MRPFLPSRPDSASECTSRSTHESDADGDHRNSHPHSHPKPHPSLYLTDGDIAFSARSETGDVTVFRVHRLVVSHYSTVLRNLIAEAAAHQTPELYDDVLLITLPVEDRADDVESLLEAIYDVS